MPRLAARDLRAALRFLAACDVGRGFEGFAASVTAALPALIPSDVAVFGLLNPREGTLRAVENPHVTSAADLETYVRLTRQNSNPLLSHFAATGDVEARRMSDFLSQRKFRHLPLYADFYRRFRVESVLGVCLDRGPTMLDGISLNRGRRDFHERERSLLTVLRPHLAQASRTARAFGRLRADLALAVRALETSGFALVVLAEDRRARLLGPRAATWLQTYFGSRRGAGRLPEPLARWVRHHVDSAQDRSGLPALRSPYVVDRGGARLVVRLVMDAPDTVLLLEEQEVRPGPAAAFAALGLSTREGEVVRWVAGGKTTPEIATILGLSPRTVQTYLERVFGKLGVETRAAAVARALGTDVGAGSAARADAGRHPAGGAA
jgi:DNA-binding CsgD family transcriptional regulator